MPVTLKIKFKSETLNQFIERYSVDISHGGIFIRTKDPLAVGTTLRFEFQLKDATPLIKGEGTVVWTREHDPTRAGVAPGMGVRFDRLPGDSQRVLEQILEQKGASAEEVEEDEDDDDGGFKDSPTRVAPAALVDKLVANDYKTRDSTPLPRPMPFHSDADDFPDETFEEATRVASLDQLVASTKSEEEAAETEADDGDEDERAATSPVVPAEAREDGGDAPEEGDGAEAQAETDAEPEASDEGADDPAHDDELAARRSAKPTAPVPQAEAGEDERAEDGDDGDDELEEAQTTVAAKPLPERRAEVATPAAAASDDDGGGNMPWIAAAAVILVLAGAGGFWFMSKGRDQARAEAPPAEEPSAVEVAAAEPAPEPAEVAEPEVETVDIQIESEPAGATASLVGTDQRAPTPATFAVEPGKSYEVEISHPGHVAQVVEVEAGKELPVVELEPMKKLVRVTSTPPGAVAWVQGRRQRGTTPLDVELDERLVKASALAVKLRKPGFEVWTESIELGGGFTEQDGVLVRTVSAELARRQVARTAPEPREAPEKPETTPPTTTDDDSSAGDEPAPSEPAEPTESAAAEPAETEPAAPAEPEPEPAPEVSEPAEPAKPETSEPQSGSSSAASEPTPAWTN